MMKRMIWMLSVAMLVAGSLSAQKAEALLDKAAVAYAKSNGIQANFAAHLRHEKAGVSQSFEGTIRMKDEKFAVITPEFRTWYNGATQWTYMVRSKEVNITSPTSDELESTNPLTLLRTYKKKFTVTYIGTSTSGNGRMADDVALTPRGRSDIARAEVQIERQTSLPSRLTVTLKDGMRCVFRISRLQTGLNPTDRMFTFNRAEYPGATEIDLR